MLRLSEEFCTEKDIDDTDFATYQRNTCHRMQQEDDAYTFFENQKTGGATSFRH